jgi:hypothetical protein
MKKIFLLLLCFLSDQPFLNFILHRFFPFLIESQGLNTIMVSASTSQTFVYNGSPQSFTVPNLVGNIISVDLSGAAGCNASNSVGTPGYGARVEATLQVTAGTVLSIYVGGLPSGATGGWNGGGNGGMSSPNYGSGGGGASDIRIGGNRVVVAGGGGGYYFTLPNCGPHKGGNGGQTGDSGTPSTCCTPAVGGGGGATQSSGGLGNCGGCSCSTNPTSGTATGIGGNAAEYGGGGGGGYYGGGGGGLAAAGGGGSSYCGGGYCSSPTYTPGYQTGAGSITITYTIQPSPQPVAPPTLEPTPIPTTQPTFKPSLTPTIQPTAQPTFTPTAQPTAQPTFTPTMQPTAQPTFTPTMQPTAQPTFTPTMQPTAQPTLTPTMQPTAQPTFTPTMQPTAQPTFIPTRLPTSQPSSQPSSQPTSHPTKQPTSRPSMQPSSQPSLQPASSPTRQPTGKPSMQPSSQPSLQPTSSPTKQPTSRPSMQPSSQPSLQPTSSPTKQPTSRPSSQPSFQPSSQPTSRPTKQPTSRPSVQPSSQPSSQPTSRPTRQPTSRPSSQPSFQPSTQPTSRPTKQPTSRPSVQPSSQPSSQPTSRPTRQPTSRPSMQPSSQPSSQPTSRPTRQPTRLPTCQPSTQPSSCPTGQPTSQPSDQPTVQPSGQPTSVPSSQPSVLPSAQPSHCPSSQPSEIPSVQPTGVPTGQPTGQPTGFPSVQPTAQPSGFPSVQPTSLPSCQPTVSPTVQPSGYPTIQPSSIPSQQPTGFPTCQPTVRPSDQPTSLPTGCPSCQPTGSPSGFPSGSPSSYPTSQPSSFPSDQPTAIPSTQPSSVPSNVPTSDPSGLPSSFPSSQPSCVPSTQPSAVPSCQPSSIPTVFPSSQPTCFPSVIPSGQPSSGPSVNPTSCPSVIPSCFPTSCPTTQPSSFPSVLPSGKPTRIPTKQPTSRPTRCPSGRPSSQPIAIPTTVPKSVPTSQPFSLPTSVPSVQPVGSPSEQPVSDPSSEPSVQPTASPTTSPSSRPRAHPSASPSGQPTSEPTRRTPLLANAAFSADGQSFNVEFAVHCTTPKLNEDFACDKFFHFQCANVSTCHWVNSKTLQAAVPQNDLCVGPGDKFQISDQADNPLCSCTPAKVCNKVGISLRETLIKYPEAPTVPSVIFNLPSVLPSCSGLNFDLSNSFGRLGRSWSRVNITVTSRSVGYDVSGLRRNIQSHFNVKYPRLTPPLQVSSSYLKANTHVNFTATICNFFGGCNTNQFTMKIVESFIPTATIVNPSLTVARSQPLLLLSKIQKSACNTSLNVNNLQYIWTVFRLSKTVPVTKILESAIKSSSKDPSRFTLNPYSLQSNQSYVVNLLTKYLDSSSTTSVQIDVKVGILQAIIQGNSQQAMRVGERQNLDGSQSYDEDIENHKAAAAGLKFSWSCSLVSMTSTDSVCSNIFNATLFQSSLQSPFLILKANQSATNRIASLKLTVSDPLTKRTSTTTITMNILPSIYPTIVLSSNTKNSINNKINPSQSLQLTANINIPTAGMNGNISWFSNDVDLRAISSTSLGQAISSNLNANIAVYLSLIPNSLAAGKSYSFGLKCQLNGNIQTTSFIAIAVNAAPSLGNFEIIPSSGTAYVDLFHLLCDSWTDSDLPLSYQFSFRSNTGLTLIIKTLSSLSYSETVLPEGSKENNKKVTCQADIYDYLNANSTVYSSAQVNTLFKANLTALVHFSIDSNKAVDLDDLIKGVNLASSILNQVNCSLAPDCTQLNRLPCLSTSHSCGACQFSYFSSSTGDGNELCVNELPDRVVTSQRLKECYLNCSSHGDCIYYSQITGNRIDSCYEGDLSCYSSCSCDVGYKLSNYCEMSDEESQKLISLRDLVVDRIVANVQYQDPSEQAVSAWVNSLLAISQVANQISEKSLASLLDLSQHAVSVVDSNEFSVSTALANYLDSMDSLTAVLATLGKSGTRRRLEATNSYTQQFSAGLKDYSLLISQSMVPGQSPSRLVRSNFKLHIQNLPLEAETSGNKNRRLSADSCSSTTEVSLPQTLLEKGLKQAPTLMTIPTCTESEPSLQISAISLSSKLFNNEDFTSNALLLSLSSHPCPSNNTKEGCSAEFFMESHNSGTGLLFATENRSVDCFVNDFTNHTVPCPNHKNYSVPCHGKAERIIFHCPSVSLLPSCQRLIGSVVSSNMHCETKSFGKENITCVCPLSPSSVSHSSSSATTDISIVALLTSVETNFVSTLLSADDLNAASLSKSWEAVVTVGLFLATILAFMCFSVHADGQAQKKVSIEEKMMEHAKVYSFHQNKLVVQSRRADNSSNQDINLFKMAEEALPGLLSCPSLNQRIWNEEKKFHRYLGIIYYFSTVFPRILRVVSLASNIIIMLFIQSLTYNYTHGDDGSCQVFSTEETCLEPRSSFGTGGSKCYWKVVDSNQLIGNCEFVQPENSIEVMLFVAIFSGLVSAPLAICVDWIIYNLLSAPNGSSAVDVFPGSEQLTEKKEVAILPSDTSLTFTSNSRERHQIAAEKDYQRLKHELFLYRRNTTDEEHRREIERLWALSGENQRLYWDDDKIKKNTTNRNKHGTNNSSYNLFLQRIERLASRSVVNIQSMSKSLRQELIQMYDNLEKESIKFKLVKTQKDLSKRLLYLFQKDLSPGITGEILESKEQRENVVLKPISPKIKFLAWFSLGVLDLGMLFYVFLFALSQDSHRQAAWGRSLGIYLFLDIVLISTLMVIFMHVLLPSLIMRDVGKIKKKVTESIKEFYVKMDQEMEKKEKEKQERDQRKNYDLGSDDEQSFEEKEDSDNDPLHLKKRRNGRNKHSRKNDIKTLKRIPDPETDYVAVKKNIVSFNAAKYLFLSYRMAEQYPDLQASQIILQYSSPWPKQDYKHIKDVKKNYSDKYSGITRAISIIVLFFLTNLLATPLAIQDMILQICTTAAIGYTMLVHIQLYYIYPALVIIPTLAFIALVFAAKHYYQKKKNEEDEKNDAEKNGLIKKNNSTSVAMKTTAATAAAPKTRRQSLQLGVKLAAQLKDKIHDRDVDDEAEDYEVDLENVLQDEEEDEEEMDYKISDDDRDSHDNRNGRESVENSESLNFQFTFDEDEKDREEEEDGIDLENVSDDYHYENKDEDFFHSSFSSENHHSHQQQNGIYDSNNERNGGNYDNETNSEHLCYDHDSFNQNHSNCYYNAEHEFPPSSFPDPFVSRTAPTMSYFPNYSSSSVHDNNNYDNDQWMTHEEIRIDSGTVSNTLKTRTRANNARVKFSDEIMIATVERADSIYEDEECSLSLSEDI